MKHTFNSYLTKRISAMLKLIIVFIFCLKGVSIAAYIHEARVLTEQQQILATPLDSSDLPDV